MLQSQNNLFNFFFFFVLKKKAKYRNSRRHDDIVKLYDEKIRKIVNEEDKKMKQGLCELKYKRQQLVDLPCTKVTSTHAHIYTH